MAGATPQLDCNKNIVKEIRLKARSRVYGSAARQPKRKGLVRENSITMLVNAKTKLQNQNHIQNSLKQVKSENPSALYRMMNPAENATKLMVRQQEEDKDVKPNHFISFREKLRYNSGGEMKVCDS